MNFDVLVNGYKQILRTIYAPKQFYERIRTFFNEYKPNEKLSTKFKLDAYIIKGLIKSVIILGIRDKFRVYFWKLFISTLVKYPRRLSLAITLAAQGFHFRKIYQNLREFKIDDAQLARQLKGSKGEAI